MADVSRSTPSRRDRAVRRVRTLSWAVAAGTAGLASALSVVAANAFKGNARGTADATPAATRTHADSRIRVPRPQHVPAIANRDPLSPPATPPAKAPAPAPAPPPAQAPAPAPAPQPQTSGGS
jgi:hypothetical protein